MYKPYHEVHFDCIDSTNTWAKENRSSLPSDRLTCVTADKQTAGRGRYKRSWISPAHENIYASFFFCLPAKTPQINTLSSLLCLSAVKVLLQFNIEPKIKWPNDITIDNRKIGGVLCEVVTGRDRIDVVLGIGLNVNSPKERYNSVDYPATSLFIETGEEHNRTQILSCLKGIFANDLEQFTKRGFKPFQKVFEVLLREMGRRVIYEDGSGSKLPYLCKSVSSDGRLNLQCSSGNLLTTSSDKIRLNL